MAPNFGSLIGLFADYFGYTAFMIRSSDPSNFSPVIAQFPRLGDMEWHFYAAVKNGSSMKLYVDSNLVATESFTDNEIFDGSIDYVEAGRHSYESLSQSYFNGAIDHLQLFDCALSELEITNLLTNTDEPNAKGGINEECMGIVETFPNPTENLINLVAQHDVIKAVELFGIDGKSIPLPYNSASNQIDVSALPAGTYFVRVACDQSVKTFKFLKIE
ncbi:MAG: LamG-like jellyroll fold domain-containing protein [Bacteroidota bacterium]